MTDKEGLVKRFKEIKLENVLENSKKEDFERYTFKKPKKYYEDLMFRGNDISNIKPKLIFTETPEQKDLWTYYRVYVSSLKTNRNPGRTIRVLVYDETSEKYLGILALGSDVCNLGFRDKYIGWDRKQKFEKKKISNIMNITVCVPLQPFGFNFNGGKLMASLAFSKEIYEYFKEKYGDELCGLTTTSIYGKSIQYDRLKCLKYLGLTVGYGHMHIPDVLYKDCLQYLKNVGEEIPSCKMGSGSNPKMRRISKILRVLKLNSNYLKHKQQRGIYFGYTGKNGEDYLCGKTTNFTPELKSVDEIFDWWKDRWGIKRFEHLTTTNRVK